MFEATPIPTDQNSDEKTTTCTPSVKVEPPPPASVPDPLDIDDGMDSMSARTEALAISSTFKLRGRGRTPSTSSQGNF